MGSFEILRKGRFFRFGFGVQLISVQISDNSPPTSVSSPENNLKND